MPQLGIFHHPTLAATEAALRTQLAPLPAAARERLLPVLCDSLSQYQSSRHGDFERWAQAVESLPDLAVDQVSLADRVTIEGHCAPNERQQLTEALAELRPWRKGPFSLFDLHIDTEWRSDWKWRRLASALGDLRGQQVLDVGCGNGYFGWRLLEAGADMVLGIDPTLLFCMQHLAINRYLRDDRNWVLPLRLEALPTTTETDLGFAGALSMGVIYHRRDPLEHIQQLHQCLRPGGWLALESLVVAADAPIYPGLENRRYARMRNVWCVPTVAVMQQWLAQSGFEQIVLLDDSVTSTEEQRSTEWMVFESLAEALHPADPEQTVDGWPRPQRAMLLARKP